MEEIKNAGHSRSWFIVIAVLGIATTALMALFAEQVITPTIQDALSGFNVQWWLTAGTTLLIFVILNFVISTASAARFIANFVIIILFKAALSLITTLVFMTQWDMLSSFEKATFFSPITALLQIIAAFLLTLFLNAFYYAEEEMEEEIAASFARKQIKLPEMEETHEEPIKESLALAPLSDADQNEEIETIAASTAVEPTMTVETSDGVQPQIDVPIPFYDARTEAQAKTPEVQEIKPADTALYKEPAHEPDTEPETILPGIEEKTPFVPAQNMKADDVARYRDSILIDVNAILSQVPQNERAMTVEEIRTAIGGKGMLPFPMSEIIEQLPEGTVVWDAADALSRLPAGALLCSAAEAAAKIPNGRIELPLHEIIRQIPYEKLTVTGRAADDAIGDFPDFFTESIQTEKEESKAIEEKKPEAAPIAEATDTTVSKPLMTEAETRIESHREDGLIRINLASILGQLPTQDIGKSTHEVAEALGADALTFPLSEITNQLSEGIVAVDAADVLLRLPSAALKRPITEIVRNIPEGRIILPLNEIIPQIPPELLISSRTATSEDDAGKYPDIFKESVPAVEIAPDTVDVIEPPMVEAAEESSRAVSEESVLPPATSEEKDTVSIKIESIIAQIPQTHLMMSAENIKLGGMLDIKLPLDKITSALSEGHVEWDAIDILSQLPKEALNNSPSEISKKIDGGKFVLPLDEIVPQIPSERLVRKHSFTEEMAEEIPELFFEKQAEVISGLESQEDAPLTSDTTAAASAASENTAEEISTISESKEIADSTDIKETNTETASAPGIEQTPIIEEESVSGADTSIPSIAAPAESRETEFANELVLPGLAASETPKESADKAEKLEQEKEFVLENVSEAIESEKTAEIGYETGAAATETSPLPFPQEHETISDTTAAAAENLSISANEAATVEDSGRSSQADVEKEYEEAGAKLSAAYSFAEEREVPLGEAVRGAFGPFYGESNRPPAKNDKPAVPLSQSDEFDLAEECIKVSAQYILSQLPTNSLCMSIDQIITKLKIPGKVMVPNRVIIPQLGEGIIEIEFVKLAPQFPQKAFSQPIERIASQLPNNGKVELSLKEAIGQLPLDVFAGHEPKKPETDVTGIPEPFGELLSRSFHEPSDKQETTLKEGKDSADTMESRPKHVSEEKHPDTSETATGADGFKLAKSTGPVPEAFKMDLSSLDFMPRKVSAAKPEDRVKPETVKPEEVKSAKEVKEAVLPIQKEAVSPFGNLELDETLKAKKEPEKVEFSGVGEDASNPDTSPDLQASKLTGEDIKEIEAILERARNKEASKEEKLAAILGSSSAADKSTKEAKAEDELERLVKTPTHSAIEKEIEALPSIETESPKKEAPKRGEIIKVKKDGSIDQKDILSNFTRLNITQGFLYAANGLKFVILTDEDTSCDEVAESAVPVVVMISGFISRYGLGKIRKVIGIGEAGSVAAVSANNRDNGRYVITAEHDAGMAGQISVFLEKRIEVFNSIFEGSFAGARKIEASKQSALSHKTSEAVGAFWENLMSALNDIGVGRCRTVKVPGAKDVVICYPEGFPEGLLDTGEPLFAPAAMANMLECPHYGPLKTAIIVSDKYTVTYSPVAENGVSGIICVFPGTYREGLAKRKADKVAGIVSASVGGH